MLRLIEKTPRREGYNSNYNKLRHSWKNERSGIVELGTAEGIDIFYLRKNKVIDNIRKR